MLLAAAIPAHVLNVWIYSGFIIAVLVIASACARPPNDKK